ncbi:23S rRNA (guanosine(2251)-2'-O)-methyltransferase RlmB [soil metagenome]
MGGRRGGAGRVTEWIGVRRPVAEALAAGREAHRLIISASARPSPELRLILDAARRAGLPVDRVPADHMTRLAGFDGHQGVLLAVGERRWADLPSVLARAGEAGHDPFVLILEHLQDPTNFGTLLRSAEAAGVHAVVFPERGAAPLSASAVKASAGASEHLPLVRLPTIGEAIHELKTAGLRLVAADQDAPASAWESDLRGPVAVVVGSEGSGLSGATKRRCDLLVSFPMAGRVASLNAATAGALLLFEVVRQRTPALD